MADIIGAAPGVDGGDDLLGVDALQVDDGGAEVGVAELALDNVQRNALAGELDGVRVAQLMRREAAAHARLGREPMELEPDRGARPGPAASRAVDDAEQRPDRQLDACGEPRRSCSQPQASMPISRRRPPLPLRTSSDPALRIEVALAQRERLLDAQPAAPEHDDERPQASAVPVIGGSGASPR